MKKIFKKSENKAEASTGIKDNTNYVGKSYSIGKYNVVVEDILAEGKYRGEVGGIN